MAINGLINAFNVVKVKLDKYIDKQQVEVADRELSLSKAAEDLKLANKLKTKLSELVT
jgi:hypothetical protein